MSCLAARVLTDLNMVDDMCSRRTERAREKRQDEYVLSLNAVTTINLQIAESIGLGVEMPRHADVGRFTVHIQDT